MTRHAEAAAGAELLSVGNRVAIDGFYGTVQYVGPVDPSRPLVLYYGIEWDDPTRGKHSGAHGGVQYFEARRPGSASFVRALPAARGRRVSLADAVIEKYTDRHAATDGHRHLKVDTDAHQNKAIEMVGFEGIYEKQSQLGRLLTVEVQNAPVDSAGSIGELVPNLQFLDVSLTLLDSWATVVSIAQQLPHLQVLHLNSLRLSSPHVLEEADLPNIFPVLRSLYINNNNVSWANVAAALRVMPALIELHASNNMLDECIPPDYLHNVTFLNLDSNLLTWPDVAPLGSLPNLCTLHLSNNRIDRIAVPKGSFSRLESLVLSRNSISDWDSIDALDDLGGLRDLRIGHNPLVTDPLVSRVARDLIVGRVAGITQLNGSQISAEDRRQNEIYLLGWLATNSATCKRHADLMRIHDTVRANAAGAGLAQAGGDRNALRRQLMTVTLVEVTSGQSISRHVVSSTTVAELRGIAARLFGMPYVHLKMATDEPLNDDSRMLSQASFTDNSVIHISCT